MTIIKSIGNNCLCNSCHSIGFVYKLSYTETYYGPPDFDLIKEQKSIWLCEKCFADWRNQFCKYCDKED